jgi:hypothetical protein
MTYNFNINPYYDDYSDDKSFYRILFKPGRAVQARELTQMQTILQKQVSRFGNHIFKEGSVVSGSEFSLDDSSFYIKCEVQFEGVDVDFSDIEGRYIVEDGTGKIGLVKKFLPAEGTDPPTVYASVVDGSQFRFSDNTNYYVRSSKDSTEDLFAFKSITSSASGFSLLFHITEGVFYGKETFLYCPQQTVVLGKYAKDASYVVGLDVIETIVNASSDTTLLDPALGSSNYLAPGADRYKIELLLTTKPYSAEAVSYENFIELAVVRNGLLQSEKRRPIYDEIGDTLARRTYDESGDYIVKNFIPRIQENANNDNFLVLEISDGKAYVRGYEIETISSTLLDLEKSRDFDTDEEYEIDTFYGNYVYVKNFQGQLPSINTQYEVEIHNAIDGLGASTLIGRAFVKSVEYISGTSTDAVYALFLRNITTQSSITTAKSFVISNLGDYQNPTFKVEVDSTGINDLGETQLFDSNFSRSFFVVPQTNIKSLEDIEYFYKQKFTQTVSSGSITIQAASSDSFQSATSATTKREHYLILNESTGEFIPSDSANLTISLATNYQAVINFGTSVYNGDTVSVIATVRTPNEQIRVKSLVTNFNKSLSVANTSFVSLMKSDVYELKSVFELESNQTYVGNNWTSVTTYSANDVILYANTAYVSLQNNNLNKQPDTQAAWWESIQNSASLYNLDNGQKDEFYDHGAISRRTPPQETINVIAVFDYFTHSGVGLLTQNSYPTSVGYTNIPNYVSSNDKTQYRLRDCVDFRPRRTDDTTDVTFSSFRLPRAFTSLNANVSFYLRKIDKVILTREGIFKVLKGVPTYQNPKPPQNQDDSITLFILNYEPYTDTPSDVKLTILPYRRYTMKDIGSLDDRITRVEYYTSLSLLEKEVESKTINNDFGEALFKNGFLVDSFKGHNVGDVTNSDYQCSIDYTEGTLRPLFYSDSIDFQVPQSIPRESANLSMSSDGIITLPYTEEVYVNQPLASKVSSVNPFDIVSFVGTLKIKPESDIWFDTETLPDVLQNVEGQNDNYNNFLSVETQWNSWETLWTGESVAEEKSVIIGERKITTTKYQIDTKQSRTGTEILKAPPSQVVSKSTDVVSTAVIPYSRRRDISFEVKGLAPRTQLYLYINERNMSNFLYPSYSDDDQNVSTYSVYTDETGFAAGVIKFPNEQYNKFLTGKQSFIVCDHPTDYRLSSSYAECSYFTQGTLQTKQTTIISTRGDYTVRRSITDNRTQVSYIQRETANVPYYDPNAPAATFTLSPSENPIIEGGILSFILECKYCPPDREYEAVISGNISSSDISTSGYSLNVPFKIKSLGSFAKNRAVIQIPITNDAIPVEDEFITLTVTIPKDEINPKFGGPVTLTSKVDIIDSIQTTYNATATSSVQQGVNIPVTFRAINLRPNTNVAVSYIATGFSAGQISGNSLTGSFIVSSNSAWYSDTNTLNFTPATGIYEPNGFKDLKVDFTLPDSQRLSTTTRVIIPTPRISAYPSSGTITEGESVDIVLTTSNIDPGTTLNYTISGVSSANINGASLTGTTTVGNDGRATVSITTTDNNLINPTKLLLFTASNTIGGNLYTSNQTDVRILDAGKISYTLSSNRSIISEGQNFIITLDTQKVSTGTSVGYRIRGNVTSSDLSNAPLTGNFTVLANGRAFLTLTANNDLTAETVEDFLIELTSPAEANTLNSGAYVSGTIIEGSSSEQALAVSVLRESGTTDATMREGNTAIIRIETRNIAKGNTIPYYWTANYPSGYDDTVLNRLMLQPRSGNLVVSSNGVMYLQFTPVNIFDPGDTNSGALYDQLLRYYNLVLDYPAKISFPSDSFSYAFVSPYDTSGKTGVTIGVWNRDNQGDNPLSITPNRSQANEGDEISFQIRGASKEGPWYNTQWVPIDNREVSFTLSGLNSNEFTYLTPTNGSKVITLNDSGLAYVNVRVTNDKTTDGDKTLLLSTKSEGYSKKYGNYRTTANASVKVIDTSLNPVIYQVSVPKTVNEGDTFNITVTPTQLPKPQTISWKITNNSVTWHGDYARGVSIVPSGDAANQAVVNDAGSVNWLTVFNTYQEIQALYFDGLNGTTTYTQILLNATCFGSGSSQLTEWQRDPEWRKVARTGILDSDRSYHTSIGVSQIGDELDRKQRFTSYYILTFCPSRYNSFYAKRFDPLPKISQLSGTLPVTNGQTSTIQLRVLNDNKILGTNVKLTFELVGVDSADGKNTLTYEFNVIDSKYKAPEITIDPKSKKITGTGDFLDRRLSYLELVKYGGINTIMYNFTGKTQAQINNDPASSGKILVNSTYISQTFLNESADWIINNLFRPSNLANRNPTVAEFTTVLKKYIEEYNIKTIYDYPRWYLVGGFHSIGSLAGWPHIPYWSGSTMQRVVYLSKDLPKGGRWHYFLDDNARIWMRKLPNGTSSAINLFNDPNNINYVTVPYSMGADGKSVEKSFKEDYGTCVYARDGWTGGGVVTDEVYVDVFGDGIGINVQDTKDTGPLTRGYYLITVYVYNGNGPGYFGFEFRDRNNLSATPLFKSSDLIGPQIVTMDYRGPSGFPDRSDPNYLNLFRAWFQNNYFVRFFSTSITNLSDKLGERPSFLACTTDPLAQTFFVSQAIYQNGIFLTGVSLYFKQKDDKLPVFVQIRPTENGYPSATKIIPLSNVVQESINVKISDDASVETRFNFTSPIFLPPGEYAIVVGSNSSKYFAYISGVGEREIKTGNLISNQPYVGSLFKSQNATTWTAEQKEDLCFKLHRAIFPVDQPGDLIFESKQPTKNIEYQLVKVTSEEIDFSDRTDITYELLMSENGTPDADYVPIVANKNISLKTTKNISSNGEAKLKLTLSTKTSDVSPVVDMERLSIIGVRNIINSESDVRIPETYSAGGTAYAKYVTRPVTLADGFEATGLRVIFDINRPLGTSVKVYYKVKASDDDTAFDDRYYNELTMVEKNVNFSSNEDQYLIDEYKIDDIRYTSNGIQHDSFKIFAIKIVMFSENPAFVPQIKNLRVIATS